MTEIELRLNFAAFLLQDAGAIEGGSVHKEVLTYYNSQSKLPRGYKLKIGDAWCAGYVSGKAIQFQLGSYIPLEVSCGKMIEKAKAMGIWEEDDSYDAQIADILLFDWDDDGKGDNTGSADHVGYIIAKRDGYYAVWEGNMGRSGYPDHVGVRPVPVNGKHIRGFIKPKYDAAANWFTWLETQKSQNDTNTEEENDMRFKNLDEIRDKAAFAAPTVEKLLSNGFMVGKGGKEGLDIGEDLLRTLVILDRIGLIPSVPKV